jgi:stage V sporulation protein D (sporulation-specific penicillin-binding protein)
VHTAGEKGRVISEEAAKEISKVLTEGVDGDGGAKNAAVEGYSVAAKTGTSQKFDVLDENGNSSLRIGSTVAYSPSDGQSIAVIIVVDEPTSSVKYGSVVAAPYVSELLSVVLPHLEYESDKEEVLVTVDNYVGKSVSDAASALDGAKINYEIIGNGKTVIAQTPSAGDSVVGSLSRIILYTIDTEKPLVTVPNLIGLSAYDATVLAIANGLNIKFEGISESRPSDKYTVSEQSLPVGARVEEGAVIVLKIMKTDFED